MQNRYSEEFKDSIIKKMMASNPVSISELVKETGVSDVTLYKWRTASRNKGNAVPENAINAEKWTSANKLATVIETAALNEAEIGEYCRTKGLYAEQIREWKTAALSGYEQTQQIEKSKQRTRQADQKQIKGLKSELRRKEKALAETAALLVLSKKWEAIWGENEEN